jgi:hypothetical protein
MAAPPATSAPASTPAVPVLSARWIRRIVLATFVLGIAGMIVASILDSIGGAITAGLITAVAVVCLVLVTTVAGPGAFAPPVVDEHAAADIERRIADLVAGGAEEAEVRALVRAARRLGR